MELGIVQRQTNGKDLGQEVDRGEGTVVVVDMVDIDGRVAADSSSDGLVTCRVEDGGA